MKTLIMAFMLFFSTNLLASNIQLDFLKLHYYFNSDESFTLTVTEKIQALSNFGAKNAQQHPITYHPDTESFKLLRAFVIKANGKKIPIKQSQIFSRSAASAANAPGFNNAVTVTVVYPNVAPKDTTFISYQITRKHPTKIDFSTVFQPQFGMAQRKQLVVLNMPKNMRMRWAKNGPFKVTDKMHRGRRIVIATLKKQAEIYAENNMIDLGHNLPYFVASTAASWETIGQRFWDGFKNQIEVTPRIKQLAHTLAHNKSKADGARAIHDWVAKNIHYIAVYMSEGAGVVPHKASTVLSNGYGDCKDKAVLMISLLKAAGITAYPVLINAGPTYFVPKIPSSAQFNHAMVYIPTLNRFDNPTSEFNGFGQLGAYSSNKFVLIAGPKTIVGHTPKASSQKNTYTSNKKITISDNGDISGTGNIQVTGRVNVTSRALINGAVLKILAKDALEQTEGGNGKITTSNPTDLDHNMQIKTQWYSPQAVNIEKETFFEIPMGIDFRSAKTLRQLIQNDERHYPTLIGAGEVTWNNDINLPRKFKLAHIPHDRHFKNNAGRYDSVYIKKPHQLIVKRHLVLNKDVYMPKDYPQLKALLYQPVKDARSVVGMLLIG